MSFKVIRKIKTMLTIFVLICLGMLCLLNIRNFISIFDKQVTKESLQGDKNVFSDVENTFRESAAYKNNLVDMYGMYHKIMDHTIVGNFEYVADKYGILHMINDYKGYETENFIQEMEKLKAYTEKREIPLLYVQAPNREIANNQGPITDFNIDDETMDTVVNSLQDINISVLDIRKKLLEQERKFELTDLYFHTDLHMQTDAEIWMANQVAQYLAKEMNINISNPSYLEDMSNYTKKSYEFSGNYERTNGKKFVENDIFDIYHPKFETSFIYEIPGTEGSTKMGNFEEVLMHGYEEQPHDEYTYWVTDYMNFGIPYYTYTNKNQNNVKLLVITDSIAYRALSYLSLTTQQITILDPRFYDGTDYTKIALENDYDAVLVWQGNYLIGVPLLIQEGN
ncbi:MAG: hypothetical protein RSF88_03180 [Lachnospiraceae bacterium]